MDSVIKHFKVKIIRQFNYVYHLLVKMSTEDTLVFSALCCGNLYYSIRNFTSRCWSETPNRIDRGSGALL